MVQGFGEILREKKLNVVIITGMHKQEVVVFDEENRAKVETQIKRSLLAGSSVTYPTDGRKVWYETDWVTKPEARFEPIWHEDGNRIRKKRIEKTLYKDGRLEVRELGQFWGSYEED